MAIVTISRKSGTGAKEIAKAVAKRLRYEFVSKDSIYAEIEEHGKKWLDRVARLDEHAPTLRERYDQSHAVYLALVEHCIYKNALKNNVVILGRGGNYLLGNTRFSMYIRTLEVHHDGTAIVLRGVCLLTKEKTQELVETAMRTAGSTRIRCELYTGATDGEES